MELQKKIKIVHIAQSDGGVLEYLNMFCENIDSSKYETYLIVSKNYEEQEKRFKNIVKEIHYVPMTREINPSSDIKSILKVKKIISKIKPDIVYLHSSKAGAIGRIAMLFDFKTKILYNAHGWAFNGGFGKKTKLYIFIEKTLALKTNKIINISKSEYDSAIKNKIAKESKMNIIENGIDFKKFQDCYKHREKTRKKYNIKDSDIAIGVVGRISEQKDPITFIKAAKIVNDKYPNTKFVYIGSGDLEEEVIKYAKKENLIDKVIITGWVNNKKEYIPILDIAVLPSKWEGFGLVLVEYMICKKPIVASKVGGILDIIKDNENGLLFNVGSEEELAQKIEYIIENKQKAKEITDENYLYCIEKYSIDNLIKKHYELFDGIL